MVVIIDLNTTKVIKFQNFGEPGADGYDLLEVCCRDSDSVLNLTNEHIYQNRVVEAQVPDENGEVWQRGMDSNLKV